MFKTCIVLALFGLSLAAPAAEAEPKAKPGLVAAAYAAPLAYTAPLAYSAAYTAPLGYYAPSYYSAGYTAYSPYTGSLVVV